MSLNYEPASEPLHNPANACILLENAWWAERTFFIDNLMVRIHFIIVMIRWTGLAPWEFEFPVPGSLTYTFLEWWACTPEE